VKKEIFANGLALIGRANPIGAHTVFGWFRLVYYTALGHLHGHFHNSEIGDTAPSEFTLKNFLRPVCCENTKYEPVPDVRINSTASERVPAEPIHLVSLSLTEKTSKGGIMGDRFPLLFQRNQAIGCADFPLLLGKLQVPGRIGSCRASACKPDVPLQLASFLYVASSVRNPVRVLQSGTHVPRNLRMGHKIK
jgi:hypothetical protein